MPAFKTALVFASAFVLQVATAQSNLTVATTSGTFQGVTTENGTDQWLGIPFAQPPVGNLRFKAPVPITSPAAGVKEATSFGDACPQPSGDLGAPIGEDCLYLNVWRPTGTNSSTGLPVLAWIYVRYRSYLDDLDQPLIFAS